MGRAPLEAALEPSNYLPLLQTINDRVEESIVVLNVLIRNLICIEKVPYFRRTIGFSPVSMVHAKPPRIPQQHVVGPQGGAQSTTTIPGGRLNEQLLEAGLPEDAMVGDTIQSHSSRHAELFQSCLSLEVSCHSQQNLFGDLLDAGSDVRVMLVQLTELVEVRRRIAKVGGEPGSGGEEQHLRGTRFAEQLGESTVEGPACGMREAEIIHVQGERAVRLLPDQLPDFFDIAGLAVGRHPDRKSVV